MSAFPNAIYFCFPVFVFFFFLFSVVCFLFSQKIQEEIKKSRKKRKNRKNQKILRIEKSLVASLTRTYDLWWVILMAYLWSCLLIPSFGIRYASDSLYPLPRSVLIMHTRSTLSLTHSPSQRTITHHPSTRSLTHSLVHHSSLTHSLTRCVLPIVASRACLRVCLTLSSLLRVETVALLHTIISTPPKNCTRTCSRNTLPYGIECVAVREFGSISVNFRSETKQAKNGCPIFLLLFFFFLFP